MEEAANELINMLMEFDHSQKEEEEKVEEESCSESKTIDHLDSEGMLSFSFSDNFLSRSNTFVSCKMQYTVRVCHKQDVTSKTNISYNLWLKF